MVGILSLCLFATGCSYISTLDPNNNSRLSALQEESRQTVLAEESGMTLKAFQQKIEELKSPRLIFRTQLEGDEIVLEAFTNPGDIQGTLDSVFSSEPELLDRVTIVNGKRGEEDFLPEIFLPEDPEGLMFLVQLETIGGQVHEHSTITLEEGSGNAAEMLFSDIRQLILVSENLTMEPLGTFYRISMISKGGVPLGELILDNGQMLHVKTPKGEKASYLLMNQTQWGSLKNRLDSILSKKEEENGNQGGNGASQGADTSSPGFNLPWGDGDALIGQASFIIEEEGNPQRILYLETAVLGRISPNMSDITLEEEFSAIWLQERDMTEDDVLFLKENRKVSSTEASQLAKEFGYEDEPSDLMTRLQEEARYDFLIQVRDRGLLLDENTNWR